MALRGRSAHGEHFERACKDVLERLGDRRVFWRRCGAEKGEVARTLFMAGGPFADSAEMKWPEGWRCGRRPLEAAWRARVRWLMKEEVGQRGVSGCLAAGLAAKEIKPAAPSHARAMAARGTNALVSTTTNDSLTIQETYGEEAALSRCLHCTPSVLASSTARRLPPHAASIVTPNATRLLFVFVFSFPIQTILRARQRIL